MKNLNVDIFEHNFGYSLKSVIYTKINKITDKISF